MTAPFVRARRKSKSRIAAHAAIVCAALAAGSTVAQDAISANEPTIAVTGIGRVFVQPTQAVVSLGATVERGDARDAQRELETVMHEAVASIRQLGIASEKLQTSGLSLMPVYSDPDQPTVDTAGSRARRDEPRIVAYRATNLVQVTIENLANVGAVIDAGVAAGVNEVRNVSFGLADDLPYRVTALERAVDAARRKARAAANALGVRLAGPIEVAERSGAVPRRELDVAFARSDATIPIEPGEVTIESVVDVRFRIDGGTAPAGRD